MQKYREQLYKSTIFQLFLACWNQFLITCLFPDGVFVSFTRVIKCNKSRERWHDVFPLLCIVSPLPHTLCLTLSNHMENGVRVLFLFDAVIHSCISFQISKTLCRRLERLAPVCVIILWAGPCSFSSFSSFCFGTIFLLVALSSSAGELPRVSGLGWGTYWTEIPSPAPRSDILCMDIASSGMIERVTSWQMGRLQMTVKNKKCRS